MAHMSGDGAGDLTQLLKGVLDLAVLAVLAERESYGYDVVRRLRERGLDGLGGASLTERLGPPEAYAAELRAAYGAAPPRSSRRPVDARPWWRRRRTLAIGAVLLVAVAGAVAWDVRSASEHPGGDAWSVSRLQSEAAAGHVSRMEFRGNGS